jgi:hypothetical protein
VDPAIGKAAETGSPRPAIPEPLRMQLAASVQQACCTVAAELAERYRKQTGAKSLCLAGGLFLNPVIVSHVEKHSGFDRVFVQPAAGNEGTALGAAWYVRHHMQGKPRQAPVEQLAWGPSYSNQEIKQVLENCKARYRFHVNDDQRLEETIQLLVAGKIVGWFQGAAEFGPRALGNRSLLASPWAPYVKENLNEYVKHREAFRPFAISITAERWGVFRLHASGAVYVHAWVCQARSDGHSRRISSSRRARALARSRTRRESASLAPARPLRPVCVRAHAGEYVVQPIWRAASCVAARCGAKLFLFRGGCAGDWKFFDGEDVSDFSRTGFKPVWF